MLTSVRIANHFCNLFPQQYCFGVHGQRGSVAVGRRLSIQKLQYCALHHHIRPETALKKKIEKISDLLWEG